MFCTTVRVTVLLEYLDLTVDTRSWVSLYNSQSLIQILQYYCRVLSNLPGKHKAAYKLIDSLFAKLDHAILTQVGFGFISLWPLIQFFERYIYNGYSSYMPSFNSFLLAVYLVGVTNPWRNFVWIILHNSVNPNQIPTKIGTKMYFSKPFMCGKCQLDWCMHSGFMAEKAKYVKLRWRRKWRN